MTRTYGTLSQSVSCLFVIRWAAIQAQFEPLEQTGLDWDGNKLEEYKEVTYHTSKSNRIKWTGTPWNAGGFPKYTAELY